MISVSIREEVYTYSKAWSTLVFTQDTIISNNWAAIVVEAGWGCLSSAPNIYWVRSLLA